MGETVRTTFRRLGPEDAEELGALFERNRRPEITGTFNPFPLERSTARRLLAPGRRDLFFGACREEGLVAFSMLRGWDEGYDVPSFGVFTDFSVQRQGLGRALTAWTLRWADQARMPLSRLTVHSDNPGAAGLYASLGYEESERHEQSDGRFKIVMHRVRRTRTPPVYVSTGCLPPRESLEERLIAWRRHGFRYIECGNYPGVAASRVETALKALGGDVLIHNYFPPPERPLALNLASPDEGVRAATREFFERAIEISARIGASHYACHAGFAADPSGRDAHGFLFPPVSDAQLRAARDRHLREFLSLADHARRRGVVLLIENNVTSPANRGKLLLDTPAEMAEFFSPLKGVEHAGLLLDVGHYHVSATTWGFDPDRLDGVLPQVRALHLHENDGSADQHRPVFAGSESLAWVERTRPDFVTLEGGYASLAALQTALLGIEDRLHGQNAA